MNDETKVEKFLLDIEI